jgi:hypothetical protein
MGPGDARRLFEGYVNHYNNVRLNSATGYITAKDMLARLQQEIHAERDRKLVCVVTFTSHEAPLLAADDRAILHGTSRWSEGR